MPQVPPARRIEGCGRSPWVCDPARPVAARGPGARLAKANEKADRRRQRRALTEEELVSLLNAARRRPLLEALTIRRGKHKGQPRAKLRPETRQELQQLGRERALIYKTMVLTGLRKGELASLTVGQTELDAGRDRTAYFVLDPQDEKNGRGSEIPIRSDLAADLRDWLTLRLTQVQDQARESGEAIPSHLPPDMLLFNVPGGLIRIFDLDLVAAGLAGRVKKSGRWVIDKRDDRGRTLDVHALRHSFATHLSRGGVAPRTAQAALRHSTLELTMNTYTDPRLLDAAGALSVLPQLPLAAGAAEVEQSAKQVVNGSALPADVGALPIMTTGRGSSPASTNRTDRDLAPNLAPALAPTGDSPWQPLAPRGRTPANVGVDEVTVSRRASDAPGDSKPPVATAVTRRHRKRAMGLEPTTFSLEG